ncbi:hypothetical protein [Cytobacillus purgationiresistens]|uniref:Transposase n=1 Tax=Cytobacillus purgationiresistens TaxID=863449 RepID=A0ABU0AJ66_9BACI|nr:hypothetical protein [Cytobacillus purgationiresistens]MDQ0271315.1 hypothetical protein [Cytobacillus purgationiresistens]
MPHQKLTIVPVTLHAENKKSLPSSSSKESLASICTIKTANAEISFFGGVDERIIQTVMREMKHL